jgi:hypothetical protein
MGLIGFIDPGEQSGWAAGWNGVLVGCGLIHVTKDRPLGLGLEHGITGPGKFWIEDPEFRRAQNRVDPNDLIALGRKVGRFQERLLILGFQVTLVRPSGWKGSIDKTIHHSRIAKELSRSERETVDWSMKDVAQGLRHNVWDAVCGYVWAAKKEREHR